MTNTPPLKQNPFSLYDFLGYFVPGAMFLYVVLFRTRSVTTGNPITDFSSAPLGSAEAYIPFVILSYVVGHILSFVSSVTIERYSIWVLGYPSQFLLGKPRPKYFDVEDPKGLRRIIRTITWLFLFPVSALDMLIGGMLSFRDIYAKKLDVTLQQAVQSKLDVLAAEKGIKDPPSGADVFRLVYHHVLERSGPHGPKMQNYVALYGFLRTICLIAVLFFWITLIADLAASRCCSNALPGLGAQIVLSFVLFMAFMKFYRRFSLEAYMGLTALK